MFNVEGIEMNLVNLLLVDMFIEAAAILLLLLVFCKCGLRQTNSLVKFGLLRVLTISFVWIPVEKL